ncbi:hypothetical protein M9H77_35608 [Catharanthus roseus]|uniref:Uncharacterized protein n=1 Tax=Catharanthus roseus TaxID=4058 RepID=A0ACB9ZQ88_CATRO|nr:hypothetical protein M9H77_35608 [Catharanthus roseus]
MPPSSSSFLYLFFKIFSLIIIIMAKYSERLENEPNSTPKLSLTKLPSKLRFSSVMSSAATPPLNRLASIPFEWEEAPGKPRSDLIMITAAASPAASKRTSVARCLDLPPRLLNSSSPTTVLDGPDHHGSPHKTVSFSSNSIPKGSFRRLHEEAAAVVRRSDSGGEKSSGDIEEIIRGKRIKVSSWRWGERSFKEIRHCGNHHRSSSSTSPNSSKSCRHANAKLSRINKRRSSFLNLSHAGSNLLSSVYGSLKQVVLRRRT